MAKRVRVVSRRRVSRIHQELEMVRQQHGGLLCAEDVVAFARNEKTALHERFEWNDGRAAQAYRLVQAQYIIRVTVTVLDIPGARRPISVRAYQSLTTDRGKEGYRATVDVLNVAKLRKQLLADALVELSGIRSKYATLKELARVHGAIDELMERG